MKLRIRTFLAGLLTGCITILMGAGRLAAQEQGSEGLLRFRPNVELPVHVPVEAGKLQLFADFDHPEGDRIPLYLVNRGRQEVRISYQDGDTYLKLERQLADGTWERAQSHMYSDCGNSYGAMDLPPGMFSLLPGYHVKQGEPATVRYASYGGLDLVSNSAPGLIDPAELKAARLDAMSVRGFPEEIGNLAHFAAFGRPMGGENSTAVAGLELARVTGGLPAVRDAAEKWVDDLAALSKPSAEQKQVLKRSREILSQPWPESPSLARLMNRCLAAINAPKAGAASPAFGTPEKEIGLVWQVLASCRDSEEFFSRPYTPKLAMPSPGIWKTVLEIAAARASKAPEAEAEGIALVLKVSSLADEYVPSAVFEELLSSSYPGLVRLAATTLARRQQWSRMVKLAFPLPKENQLIAFQALSGFSLDNGFGKASRDAPVRYRPADTLEQVFWDRVLRAQPLKVCELLVLAGDERNPWDRSAFGELLSYWQRELARSQAAKADFPCPEQEGNPRWSVRFIAGWNAPADVPLLRGMLEYRGYCEDESTESDPPCRVVKRVFPVRREAADALLRRGEPLPQNLVFETEISRTPVKGK